MCAPINATLLIHVCGIRQSLRVLPGLSETTRILACKLTFGDFTIGAIVYWRGEQDKTIKRTLRPRM